MLTPSKQGSLSEPRLLDSLIHRRRLIGLLLQKTRRFSVLCFDRRLLSQSWMVFGHSVPSVPNNFQNRANLQEAIMVTLDLTKGIQCLPIFGAAL